METKEMISKSDFDKTKTILHPKMDRGKAPKSFNIPTTCEILDDIKDKDGKVLRKGRVLIRYLQGETEIYANKQSEDAAKKKQSTIIVRDGAKIISNRETTLLEYLAKCDYNGSKLDRDPSKEILFVFDKPAEKAAAFVNSDRKSLDLRLQIHNMEISELEMYALALNINNPQDKPSEELRRDMLLLAVRQPQLFEDGLKNMPKMTRKYHLTKACQVGIIRIESGTVKWSDGGVIVQAPIGKEPIDYFVDFTYQEIGEEVYKEIKRLLSPKDNKVAFEESAERSEPTITVNQSPESAFYELIKQASEQKILIKKGPVWIGVAGTVKGDPYHVLGKDVQGIEDALKKDTELVNIITSRLQ